MDFKKINSPDSSTFVLILTPDTFRDMTDTTTQSSSKSVAQKLDKALEYKDIGNSFYKEGNFKNAARNYHRAILYLKGIDTDLHGTPAFLQAASVDLNHEKHIDKDTENKCIQTNISVYNNLCACLLAQPDASSERIKELAEIVIELDGNSEKAWYRRGQACVRLKDFDKFPIVSIYFDLSFKII